MSRSWSKLGFSSALVGAIVSVLLSSTPARAGLLSPCQVDIEGEVLCVNGSLTCLLGLQLHVCLGQAGGSEACDVDPGGGILCSVGSLVCNLGGVIEVCPSGGDDDCLVDINGGSTCPLGLSACLLGGVVQVCNGEGGPVVGEDEGDNGGGGNNGGGDNGGGDNGGGDNGGGDNGGGDNGGGGDDGDGGGGGGGAGGHGLGVTGPRNMFDPDDPSWHLASGGGCSTSSSSSSSALVGLALAGCLALGRRRRRQGRLARAGLATGIACVAATTASAEGLNADLMRSNTLGQGGVAVGNTDTLEPYTIRAGMFADFARDPLELRDQNGNRVMGVVDGLTTLDLRVGVGLPHGVEVSVLAPVVLGRSGMDGLGASGMGDLGIAAKWGTRLGRFGVAVSPEVIAPTGDAERFASDGTWQGIGRITGDVRLGTVTLAATTGGRLRGSDPAFVGAKVGNQALWGAMVDWAVFPKHAVHLIGEVHGARSFGDSLRANPAEALGEVRWSVGDWIMLAGAGMGLSNSVGVPEWRAFIGGAYTLGESSRREPPLRVASVEPQEPARAPAEEIVPAAPVVLDTDGDGIDDASDACVEQPETFNGFEDADGCPDEAPRYVFSPDAPPLVFHNIHFETGKWRLLPESYPVLDEIAASLRSQPDVRIRIEGHTDSRGGDAFNLTLSQQRGLAAMNYLIGAGIDPARLEYAGFGLSRPLSSNATTDGRALNRRVEVRTLSNGVFVTEPATQR